MGTGDLPPQGQLQAKGNDLPQLPLALAAPATPKPTTKLISSSNGDEIQPHTPSFTGPVPCTTRLQPTRLTQPSSTRGLDEPISARGELPPSSTVDGHYLGACMESVTSPAKQVPQKSLTNITKFADPGAAGKVKVTTFAPMTDCQTGGDKEYITSNEKPAIGLNPFHDCNDASPLPCRNANPIPTGTLINFERRKFQSVPPTEAMYSPIAPATPNQSKRVQYCMPSTVGELVARSTHGNGMSKPPANEHVVESERASYIPSREAESSSQRSSAQEMVTRKMVEEEEQGTDSSKTPRQKPKRRKHRPKVVREDKSNKTPKPGTPKPVTPEPIRPKQENRVKRKYVRKKLGLEHPGTPSTTLHEHMDQCDSTRTKGTPYNKPGIDAAKHGKRKYVRKIRQNHLESTSDMVTETDGGHKAENPRQNIETEISERKRTRRKYMPQKKSLHDSETPPNAARGTANLRDSSDPKEIVREQVGYKTRLVRRRLNFDSEGQTVNGKSVALLTNSRTASPAKEECSDTITLSASRSTVQLDHGFEVGVENTPGGVAYNLNLTLSKMSEEYTKLPEQAIPTQLCRGERLEENSRELVEHSDVSSCATTSGGVPQIELQQTKMQDGVNGTSDVLLEENIITKVAKRGALHEVRCHETSRHTPILPNIYKKRRTEKAYRQRNINSSWTYFGSHMFTVATLDKLMTLQKSQDNEHILRFDQMEVATRKRSKVSIRARNSCSLTKLAEKFSAGTWPKKKSRSVSETLQDERLHRIEISYIYDSRSSRNIQKAVHSNFMTRDIVPYVDPVDDIIQKLKYLSIAGGSQVQNALTIYARETMMLPMSGPFDLTLKRQPRPKVDLDPETHRVWKLLMGKAGNNKAETINVDKDKRWQEERQVFRGRVDSFIARMHLVQGDRRFCPWKGSVVDSVVGVFLTQNVSDHLSSSAFMALAARFPPQPRNNVWELDAQKLSNALYQQDGCKQQFNCSTSCGRMSILEVSSQLPMRIREADDMEEEMANRKASLRSNTGDPSGGCSTVNSLQLYEKYVEVHHQILDNRTSSPNFIAGSNSLAGIENKASEDLIASQVYADPSKRYSGNLIQMDQIAPSSESNSETELTVQSKCSCLENFSFMELLQIEDRALIHSYCTHNSEYLPSAEYCHQLDEMPQESTKSTPSLDQVNDYKERCPPTYSPDIDSNYQCKDMPYLPSIACCFQKSSESGSSGVQVADKLEDKIKYYFPPTDSGSNSPKHIETTNLSSEYAKEATTAQWQPAVSGISVAVASYPCKCKPHIDLVTCSVVEECFEEQCSSHLPREESKAISCIEARDKLLQLHEEHPAKYQQNKVGTDLRAKGRHHAVKASSKTHEHCEEHQTFSNSCNNLDENSVVDKEVELNQKDKDQYSQNAPLGKTKIASSTKKVKADRKANKPYDWDSLRKQASSSSTETQRNNDRRDSLDWEALRNADVGEISQTIRERGMNNVLAERIKDFLNRLVLDHGSIDLEWLRNIEPDKAKDYLLSIRGLGLKSVECVRLLTLQHLAFPVDTNVGRICVRLGWVPLQPLPESLQLHLLELYPVLETIQKYLWPRLCMLDQRTLYELHYQMITFGKVFCTKSKPNCNACPMRGECKHFASAFASARLALPAPEEKSLVSTTPSTSSENKHYPLESRLLPHPLDCQLSWERPASNNSEPIIEEPMTPEPENKETLETEIEDTFYEDPDQIPTIKLNLKEFAQNVQDAIRANNNELQDGDLSKSLVTISPEAASIPMPKLKNVSRLRTEHQVYELPDSHPLLEEMDRREPDDPSPYLLAIWTPGETAESTEPPEICCNSQDTGALCEKEICFACNSIREARARTVRGTLLIPCRTAMRGSFPLNGTYFQVNEVFADHDSSFSPLNVPRGWIWNLPRRTVYFGTSVPTIFRGLTTEETQKCFWRGFVCVRGFDRKSRAPKPLYPRLHFPASKARGNRKQATNEE